MEEQNEIVENLVQTVLSNEIITPDTKGIAELQFIKDINTLDDIDKDFKYKLRDYDDSSKITKIEKIINDIKLVHHNAKELRTNKNAQKELLKILNRYPDKRWKQYFINIAEETVFEGTHQEFTRLLWPNDPIHNPSPKPSQKLSFGEIASIIFLTITGIIVIIFAVWFIGLIISIPYVLLKNKDQKYMWYSWVALMIPD